MSQTTSVTRSPDTRIRTAIKPSNLDKAITAFAFSDLTVRPCGHGLPPSLPYRQDDWTLTEILKSDLRWYSIIDRAIKSRLDFLDASQIPYDHIYIGHQDKKPFKVPEKVVSAITNVIPVLAFVTGALLALLVATVSFTANAILVADPIVVVAIREQDGSFNLLEISKWFD